MNDVNKICIVLSDPLRTIGSVEPRFGRIESCNASNFSKAGFLDLPSDVRSYMRSETVSDNVDLLWIQSFLSDQLCEQFSDVFSDLDCISGGHRIVVPR